MCMGSKSMASSSDGFLLRHFQFNMHGLHFFFLLMCFRIWCIGIIGQVINRCNFRLRNNGFVLYHLFMRRNIRSMLFALPGN